MTYFHRASREGPYLPPRTPRRLTVMWGKYRSPPGAEVQGSSHETTSSKECTATLQTLDGITLHPVAKAFKISFSKFGLPKQIYGIACSPFRFILKTVNLRQWNLTFAILSQFAIKSSSLCTKFSGPLKNNWFRFAQMKHQLNDPSLSLFKRYVSHRYSVQVIHTVCFTGMLYR